MSTLDSAPPIVELADEDDSREFEIINGVRVERFVGNLGSRFTPPGSTAGTGNEASDDFELIDGRRVDRNVGSTEGRLASWLAYSINAVAVPRKLGFATMDTKINFGDTNKNHFVPDVAYVSSKVYPIARPIPVGEIWAAIPELVVEVVSPSNTANEIHRKVSIYLAAGVRFVWVVYLDPPAVYIFDGSNTVRLLQRTDTIDLGNLIPGLMIPIIDLFPNENS